MSSRADNFMTLLDAGKIDEARAMLETEKANAKFFPDTVVARPRKPRVSRKMEKL